MNENFNCDICGIKCSGIEPYVAHVNGIKHKRKAEHGKMKTTGSVNSSLYCQLCDVTCSGTIPFQQHMTSDKHLRKKEQAKVLNEGYRCMSSDTQDHLESQSSNILGSGTAFHKKKSQNSSIEASAFQEANIPVLPVESLLQCKVCVKCFTGPVPFEQHMNSAVHQKNVKKAELWTSWMSGKNDFPRNDGSSAKESDTSVLLSGSDTGKPSTSVEAVPPASDTCDRSCFSMEVHDLRVVRSECHEPPVSQCDYSPSVSVKTSTDSTPFYQHIIASASYCKKLAEVANYPQEDKSAVSACGVFDCLESEVLPTLGGGNMKSLVGECHVCSAKFYSDKEVLEHYETEIHHDNQDIYDYKRKVKVFAPEEPFHLTA